MKTLKDLGFEHTDKDGRLFTEKELRAEAVKWIKEDLKIDGVMLTFRTQKWMQRLNITEEDLK